MAKQINEFANVCEEYLGVIQEQFDDYQQTNFPKRPAEFFCLELNGEAGELANSEKKLWKGKNVPFDMFEDEAADVLISLMNYCNERSVNLGKSVREKLLKIDKKRLELKKEGKEF
jgi:NTP pyrophosphatase (non-canonical NTP hydrolase)